MIKLSQKVLSGLGKYPRTKPKPKNIVDGVNINKLKKSGKNNRSNTSSPLERSPKNDTFSVQTNKNTKAASAKKQEDRRTHIGDFLVKSNMRLAEDYKSDFKRVALEVPGTSFMMEANTSSAKGLKSILEKLASRSAQFPDRGYRGVIRDGVRATIFMPDADKNFPKIIKAMENKGYKIAKTFAEDANGNIVLNRNGMPKMVDDIDVRFGDNAVPSGYEDVQIRFEKGDKLYELLILPGPNYAVFKEKEHKMVFENLRKYKDDVFRNDEGAKQIIKAIQKEFHTVTRPLYKQALERDVLGSRNVSPEPITFTEKGIDTINKLFKSLKTLYRGKFDALPPSKKSKPDFRQTKNYRTLDMIENNLRKFMEEYKPITQ